MLAVVDVYAQTITLAPLPSEAVSFQVTMTNNGSAVVEQPLFSLPSISGSVGTLSASEPCQVLTGPLNPVWELRAPALDPGESRACEVTFTRTALSPIASFAWRPSPSSSATEVALIPSTWAFGVFHDPSISIESVHPLPFPGATEALFRITVTNPGSVALVEVEAGGCQFVSTDMVTMDAEIPGGCTGMTHPYLFCFTGHSDFGVALPDVAAGSQSSCLVRARRASGLVVDSGWPFELFHAPHAPTANGYVIGDSNPVNNTAYAAVSFFVSQAAIPAGHTAVFAVLAFAIFSLALIRIRRQGSASTSGVAS